MLPAYHNTGLDGSETPLRIFAPMLSEIVLTLSLSSPTESGLRVIPTQPADPITAVPPELDVSEFIHARESARRRRGQGVCGTRNLARLLTAHFVQTSRVRPTWQMN